MEEGEKSDINVDDITQGKLRHLISEFEELNSDYKSRIRNLENKILMNEGRASVHRTVELFIRSHPEYAEKLNDYIISYCLKMSKEKADPASNDYESFVGKYPDAAVHKSSLANLLDADANLSLHDAYVILKQYYKRKGFDWSKPMDLIENEFLQNIDEKLLQDYADLNNAEADPQQLKNLSDQMNELKEARDEYEADAREEHQSLLQEAEIIKKLTNEERISILRGVDFFMDLDNGKVQADNQELSNFVSAAHGFTEPSSVNEKAYAKFNLFSNDEIRKLYSDVAEDIIIKKNRYKKENEFREVYERKISSERKQYQFGLEAWSDEDIEYQTNEELRYESLQTDSNNSPEE
jgi:uncharacterized protein YifE (UPF0438 family)